MRITSCPNSCKRCFVTIPSATPVVRAYNSASAELKLTVCCVRDHAVSVAFPHCTTPPLVLLHVVACPAQALSVYTFTNFGVVVISIRLFALGAPFKYLTTRFRFISSLSDGHVIFLAVSFTLYNEEGDTTVAALREANLRIDKLSAGVQALEEVDGKVTTSRSSSSETEGEIWNCKWHNGSWWFRAGPRVNSRQRRSIARMVQRVEMSGWQDKREKNMCFPWVPFRIGRKGSTDRRGMMNFEQGKRR